MSGVAACCVAVVLLYRVFKGQKKAVTSDPDTKPPRTTSFTTATNVLEYLWKSASDDEKVRMLSSIANGGSTPTSPTNEVGPMPSCRSTQEEEAAAALAVLESVATSVSRRASTVESRLTSRRESRVSHASSAGDLVAPESRRISTASTEDEFASEREDELHELKQRSNSDPMVAESEDLQRLDSIMRLQMSADSFLEELESSRESTTRMSLDLTRLSSFTATGGDGDFKITPRGSVCLPDGTHMSGDRTPRSREGSVSLANSPCCAARSRADSLVRDRSVSLPRAKETPTQEAARRDSVRSAQTWLQRQMAEVDDGDSDRDSGRDSARDQSRASQGGGCGDGEDRVEATTAEVDGQVTMEGASEGAEGGKSFELGSPHRASSRRGGASRRAAWSPNKDTNRAAACGPEPAATATYDPYAALTRLQSTSNADAALARRTSGASMPGQLLSVKSLRSVLPIASLMRKSVPQEFYPPITSPRPPASAENTDDLENYPLPVKFHRVASDRSSYSQQIVADVGSTDTDSEGSPETLEGEQNETREAITTVIS